MNKELYTFETTMKNKIEMTRNYEGSFMQANTNLIREYKENMKHLIKVVEATHNDAYTLMMLRSFERGMSFDMNTTEKKLMLQFATKWVDMVVKELKEATKWLQ